MNILIPLILLWSFAGIVTATIIFYNIKRELSLFKKATLLFFGGPLVWMILFVEKLVDSLEKWASTL